MSRICKDYTGYVVCQTKEKQWIGLDFDDGMLHDYVILESKVRKNAIAELKEKWEIYEVDFFNLEDCVEDVITQKNIFPALRLIKELDEQEREDIERMHEYYNAH